MNETPNSWAGKRHWVNTRPQPPELAYLGPIGIEVVDATGTTRYDPNGIVVASITGELEKLAVLPDRTSVISGAPAILYRTSEVELAITPEELDRLVQRSLTPDEFTAICNTVGAIYELHDDFYDPGTGEALQPMYGDEEDEEDDEPHP